MSTAVFFMSVNCSVLIRLRLESMSGEWSETTSELMSSSSRDETRLCGMGGRPDGHSEVQARGEDVGE